MDAIVRRFIKFYYNDIIPGNWMVIRCRMMNTQLFIGQAADHVGRFHRIANILLSEIAVLVSDIWTFIVMIMIVGCFFIYLCVWFGFICIGLKQISVAPIKGIPQNRKQTEWKKSNNYEAGTYTLKRFEISIFIPLTPKTIPFEVWEKL